MINRYAIFTAFMALLGCDAEDTEAMGGAEDVILTITEYQPQEPHTEEDIDQALDDGLSWEQIEEQGLAEIIDQERHTLAAASLLDGGEHAKDVWLYATAMQTNVSAGSTINFSWDNPPQGFEYYFDILAKNYATGHEVESDKARGDFYRYTSDWDWQGSDTTVSHGYLYGSAYCGSACSKIRVKIQNKATTASHNYTVNIQVY